MDKNEMITLLSQILDERIGMVTAYAYAKSKGYSGSADDFANDMANIGVNISAIETAINTFNNETVPNAETAINTAGSNQVTAVNTAGQEQLQNVTAEGGRQVGLVAAAGSAQTEAVNTAGSTQVNAVNSAGSTQVSAVQAKGQEVLNSIPSDYTELSNDVDDLESSLPLNTKEGNPIVVNDAIAINAKSLMVNIEPQQSFNGYAKPWAGGEGANKLAPAESKTIRGVTFAVQNDGSVHVTGTATGGAATLDIGRDITTLSAGTWFALALTTSVAVSIFKVVNGSASLLKNGAGAFTLTETTSVFMRLSVANGTSVDETDYPGFFESTSQPTWTPYANVCPIEAFTSVTVNVAQTVTAEGTDYTLPLGTSIYGGSVDAAEGKLTVTHGNIASYNGEAINAPWYSSLELYAEGATPTTGAQVVYPLSTPTESTITGVDITLNEGDNVVSTNLSASIKLTYNTKVAALFPDRAIYVNEHTLTDYGKGYIVGNTVGTAMDFVRNPRDGSSYVSLVKRCFKGDVFKVTALGGNLPRAWVLTDTNGIILSVSAVGSIIDAEIVVKNDGYFVTNSTYEVDYSTKYTGFICADDVLDTIELNASNIEKINDYLPFVPESAPSGAPVVTSATYNSDTEMALTDIYTGYEAMLSAYPNYVTRTTLGNDQSGTYPIYRYDFIPEMPLISQSVAKADGTKYTSDDIPVIILEACLHGSEKPCAKALLNLMDKICSSIASNDVFGWLRRNFHVVVIPVVNPWGYVNGTRWNSRHVDLNRNFPIYWENGTDDPTDMHYRGESAGSEAETQYVMDIIDEYADKAYLFYDYHTYGVRDIYRNQTDYEISFYKTNLFQQIGLSVVWDITKSGWNNHELPTNSGFIGFVQVYTGERVGMAMNYGAYKHIPSATPECMYRYNDGTSTDTDYSPKINYMNIEYMMYTVFNALKKLIEYGV